jgi:hypothetical protein
MQISRHWRLNAQRYRLEGYRNANGEVSIQRRPVNVNQHTETETNKEPAVPTSAR